MGQLGVPASRAVMVGNSLPHDIDGARRAGVFGVWVNRTDEHPPEHLRPDAEIANLLELEPLLRQR